jgi:hypothetical protein
VISAGIPLIRSPDLRVGDALSTRIILVVLHASDVVGSTARIIKRVTKVMMRTV